MLRKYGSYYVALAVWLSEQTSFSGFAYK
jgi:hypothetical protein